jgi:hypothetical protein
VEALLAEAVTLMAKLPQEMATKAKKALDDAAGDASVLARIVDRLRTRVAELPEVPAKEGA